MIAAEPRLAHVVIARDPAAHFAFPDAARLASGDILVVYRAGRRHVDRTGRILLSRCRTPEEGLVFDDPDLVCDTDLDDRDPSVVQLADGTVLLNFFRLDVKNRSVRLAITASRDGGCTWATPRDIATPGFAAGLAVSDAVLELPGGVLLMAAYGTPDQGRPGSFLFRSIDGGDTWPEIVPLAVHPTIVFEEPALSLLPDGRIVAMLRSENGGSGSLYQTCSSDGGATWSEPERLDLWGYPADLLTLPTGQVVAAYGYRQFPPGIRYCVAEAAGLSWPIRGERILRHDGHDSGELGYPATVALDDGVLLTVYYFTGREGGQPYIAGTIFTVE